MPSYVVAQHTMTFAKEILQEVTPIYVLLRPIELGRTRMVFEELLLDSLKRVCNISHVTLVAWDMDRRTSREFSDKERRALEEDLNAFHGISTNDPNQH